MIIKSLGAMQDFVKLWDSLIDKPDLEFVSLKGIQIAEAVALSKMPVTLTGTSARGIRFAGQYHEEYVIVHGEYGYLVMRTTADNKVVLEKSTSYVFKDAHASATVRMDELASACLLTGLKIPTLMHWYDSVYRKVSGKHVSQNFCPFKSLDKSAAMIVPGLVQLMKIKYPEETISADNYLPIMHTTAQRVHHAMS